MKKTPFSAAEIALAGNIPTIMVTGCNKGGIETAALDLASHLEMMEKLGIKTVGAILNKVYHEKIAENASRYIKKKHWAGLGGPGTQGPAGSPWWNSGGGDKTGKFLPEGHGNSGTTPGC